MWSIDGAQVTAYLSFATRDAGFLALAVSEVGQEERAAYLGRLECGSGAVSEWRNADKGVDV